MGDVLLALLEGLVTGSVWWKVSSLKSVYVLVQKDKGSGCKTFHLVILFLRRHDHTYMSPIATYLTTLSTHVHLPCSSAPETRGACRAGVTIGAGHPFRRLATYKSSSSCSGGGDK